MAVVMTMVQGERQWVVSVETVLVMIFPGLSVQVESLTRLLGLTYRAGPQTGEGMEVRTPGLRPRQLLYQSENLQNRRHEVALPMWCRSWYVVVRALRP